MTEHFIMFFRKESKVSMVPQFVRKSEHWHEMRDQKKKEINLPLRAFFCRSLLDELLTRLKKVSQSPDQLALATQLQVFRPKKADGDALLIPYLVYNQEGKRLEPPDDRQPISPPRMLEIIAELQAVCVAPLGILRFHSTQKLSGPLHEPTAPFLLQRR